jgi:WxcM-like protein
VTGPRAASVGDCEIVELTRHISDSGSLTTVAPGDRCPFAIRRVYYLFDIPSGAARGGHAHRALHQLLVAASGSFDVLLDDGSDRRTVTLNRPDRGLHLVPGIWRELCNFSSGSICLVMASELYDEEDYLRDHDDFLAWKTGAAPNVPS